MYIDYKLEGKYVNLRSVTEDDAEFILLIRNNPEISKYLPPLNVTVEQQRQWIVKQQADKSSYYFILETPDLKPIGTLSVYDIEDDHAEYGRLCSIGEPAATIEAGLLLIDFIFNELQLAYTTIWVYEENKPVISLNQSYGYEWGERKVDQDGRAFRVGVLKRDRALLYKDKILKRL